MRRKREKDVCLCSELVTVQWTDAFSQKQEAVVNLEEIWPEGGVLQFEYPMRPDTAVRVLLGHAWFEGAVVDSKSDFVGHYVEIRFDEGHRWSPADYEPEHFFDPKSMTATEELRGKNNKLLGEVLQKIGSLTA